MVEILGSTETPFGGVHLSRRGQAQRNTVKARDMQLSYSTHRKNLLRMRSMFRDLHGVFLLKAESFDI